MSENKEGTVRMLLDYWPDLVVHSVEKFDRHFMLAIASDSEGMLITWYQQIEGPVGQLPIWAKDVALEAFNKHRNLNRREKKNA